MTRRNVIAAAALVVLVAVVVGSVAVVRGLRGDDRPMADPMPAEGVLTPQEQTVQVRVQPDGSLAVSTVVVFDAGAGSDRPVRWVTGPARLAWVDDARRAQYWVQPVVDALTARVTDPARPATDLAVSTERDPRHDPFLDPTVYRLAPTEPWSPGRHRVEVGYRLRGVHLQADGATMLALPLGFPAGPSSGQRRDLTRIAVSGASRLECPATNTTFADRRPCPGEPGRLAYRTGVGVQDQVEAVLIEPVGVTAVPAPAPRREVR